MYIKRKNLWPLPEQAAWSSDKCQAGRGRAPPHHLSDSYWASSARREAPASSRTDAASEKRRLMVGNKKKQEGEKIRAGEGVKSCQLPEQSFVTIRISDKINKESSVCYLLLHFCSSSWAEDPVRLSQGSYTGPPCSSRLSRRSRKGNLSSTDPHTCPAGDPCRVGGRKGKWHLQSVICTIKQVFQNTKQK